MTNERDLCPDCVQSRRTFLKGAAATGVAASGIGVFGSSAAAQPSTWTGRISPPGTETDNLQGVTVDGQSVNPEDVFQGVQLFLTEVTTTGSGAIQYVLQGQFIAPDGSGRTRFTETVTETNPTVTQNGECEVLFLELGPIELRLLGLDINISQITIEITARQGGGILGDLLCALAGGPN